MIKIKNHRILSIRISIVCIDGQCRKSYLWLVLSGLKNHLISNEDFIKNHTPDSDIRYLLAADVQYPEEPQAYHNYYPFQHKERILERLKHLQLTYITKTTFCAYIKFKTSIKSCISTRKSAKSHQIQTRCLAQTMHQYEYRAKRTKK